ncbi:uncharacterized protein LAESUDRAFT_609460, partial [Laetiporus sulphureus 93-53]
YKPVHRKVRPVPTYMPNPAAQVFSPIIIPKLDPLPTHPPPRIAFIPTNRLMQERLDAILHMIPANFLWSEEIDLLIHVLDINQQAVAWTDAERGTFSRKYFPDYEIPVIKHTPWVNKPIPIPRAIEEKVRAVLRSQEAAGKYEHS